MSKRKTFWFAVIAAAGSLLSLYIKTQHKKRQSSVPIDMNQMGTTRLSAVSLEHMIVQLLSEKKHVQPLGIKVHFDRDHPVHISGAVELRQSRFTPSMAELKEHILVNLTKWTGMEVPDSALQFKTIRK